MANPQDEKQQSKLEGEGNRTADREYREHASAHAKNESKVKQAAEQAKRALEDEGEPLAAAEVEGKAGRGAAK